VSYEKAQSPRTDIGKRFGHAAFKREVPTVTYNQFSLPMLPGPTLCRFLGSGQIRWNGELGAKIADNCLILCQIARRRRTSGNPCRMMSRFFRRTAVSLGVTLAAGALSCQTSFGHPGPCVNVERRQMVPPGWQLSPASTAWLNDRLAPEARPLDGKKIHFQEALRYGHWQIILVQTDVSDDVFLFFPGDPGKSQPVTLWSGAATIFDEQAIFRWTEKNAPGIPTRLAKCFAWSVTPRSR
jgi:hypothetical protein